MKFVKSVLVFLTISLLLLTCKNPFEVGLGEKVDIDPPKLSITSHSDGDYIAGVVSLSGTYEDDIGVQSLSVILDGQEFQAELSNGNWSYNLTSTDFSDGPKDVLITVTDGSNKKTINSVLLIIDNIAPTVLITVPQTYGAQKPTKSTYIDIRGEAYDASPIDSIVVSIYKADGSFVASQAADGTNNWFTRFQFDLYSAGTFPDKTDYEYFVEITDIIGNANTYIYHAADIWGLVPSGELFPPINEIGSVDQTEVDSGFILYNDLVNLRLTNPTRLDFFLDTDTDKPTISFSNLDPDLPVTDNVLGKGVPVIGYVSDDKDGIEPTTDAIKLRVTDSPIAPYTVDFEAPGTFTSPGEGLSVNFEFTLENGGSPLTNGSYYGTMTVTDKGGAINTSTVQFLIDSSAPVFTDISPETGNYLGLDGAVYALFEDDNAIVSIEAEAFINDGSDTPIPVTVSATPEPGGSPYPGYTKITIDVPVGVNNVLLGLRVTDESGATAFREMQYFVDRTPPEVFIDVPVAGAWSSGSAITVAGTASADTLKVYYWIGLEGAVPPDIALWDLAQGNINWDATISLVSLAEDNYTLHVRAEDRGSNLSAEVIRTFGFDNGAPTLTETGVTGTETYINTTYSLTGVASDTNGLTGLIINRSFNGAAVIEVLNLALTGTNSPWSLDNEPDAAPTNGQYDYTIILEDKAGRTTTLNRSIIVDTGLPIVNFNSVSPIVGTDKVNGSVDFSISASDVNGLTGVKYWVLPDTDPAPGFATAGGTSWPTPPYQAVLDSTGFTDGLYKIWIVARDKAQNEEVISYSIDIDQSSDKPRITANSITYAGPNALGRDPAILFTVEDDDGVDVDKIQYSLNSGAAWSDLNPVMITSDTVLVQAKTNLIGITQGNYLIRFRAMDIIAGADWIIYGTANIHWVETSDYPFTVDYGPPSITLTVPAASTVVKDNFTVSGEAVDFNGVTDIAIEMQGSTYTKTYVSGTDFAIIPSVDPTPVAFSFIVPIDTDVNYVDGDYNLQIRATDASGTVGTMDRPIGIDQTPPTVVFTQPAEGSTVNGTIMIRGEVDDNRQVTHTYLWHGLQATTPPALADPSWNDLGSSLIWSYNLDTSPVAPTGAYKVVIITEDVSGNLSGYQTLNLNVDQNTDRPTIELTNLVEGAVDNALGRNARITGNIGDDDGAGAAGGIQIRLDPDPGAVGYPNDNNGWVDVSDPPANIGTLVSWYHDISALNQGPHTTQVRTRDENTADNSVYGDASNYGWTLGPVVDFYIDYGPPTLIISSPESGAVMNADFPITGTATDANSVTAVEITFNGGTDWYPVSTADSFANWSYTYTVPAAGTAEQVVSYQVRATDNSAAETTLDRQVIIDVKAPVITGISQPAASQVVNGTIDISGQANDGYKLEKVYYHVGAEFVDGITEAPAFDPVAPGAEWTLLTGAYAWNGSIDTTVSLVDGDYTLYAVGVDSGNNYTDPNNLIDSLPRRDFAVNQISDRPIISLSTLSTIETAQNNLLPPSLQISGTVEDDDAVKSDSIEIRVDSNNDGDFLDGGLEAWAAVTGQPAIDGNVVTWSHTFSGLTDGQYSFQLRATDANFSGDYGVDIYKWDSLRRSDDSLVATVLFSVDLANPAGTIDTPDQGTFHKSDVNISGTASDASGIKSVEIKFGIDAPISLTPSTLNNIDYTWSYDYIITGDGQVSYQLIFTDNYDKIFTIDRYFTIDTTGPGISFFQPSDEDTVNGSLLVRGEASDTRLVDKVYVWVGEDLELPVPGNPDAGDWTGWSLAIGTFSWSHRINTTVGYPDGPYDVHVRAVDGAGNISADNILNINIDQSGNFPVFSQLNLNAAPVVNLFGAGGTISGTITDDDGVDASTIEIRFDLNDDGDFLDGGLENWTAVTGPGTTGVSVSFSHDLSGVAESGTEYPVELRASDIGEAIYGVAAVTTTTATGQYNVAVDRSLPALSILDITLTDRYSPFAPRTITGVDLPGALLNNNFTLRTSISDPSGIDSVLVSVNGGAFSNTGVTDNLDGTWNYEKSVDLVLNTDDGNKTLTVKALDTWGREATSSLTVVIDTTEPTVTYIEPAVDANVNGTVTVRGTTLDNGTIQSLTITAGRVNNPTSPVTLTNTGTNDSWITTFDAYAYDEGGYATVQGNGTWLFPLTVTAIDAAENKTESARNVYLDPDGDKPVIVEATLIPANDASVSGTIVLQSTVTDDDTPAYVRIYADLDDDGIITSDGYPVDLSPFDVDTLDPFEEEDNYLEVTISNGVWTTLVNENGEFSKADLAARGVPSPTGYIRFHIDPYDINGTAGNRVIRRVYIDATSPEILGVNYSSGALVKGVITVTGTIRDDVALTTSYIQVSYDGGSTYQQLNITAGPVPDGDFQKYTFSETIDTTAGGFFPDASGILYTVIKVTDNTYKQTSLNLNFNVDNELPTALFDFNNSLPYVGANIYTFEGDIGDPDAINQVLGSATDGLGSGIEKINVYFVKDGNFESPKAAVAPVAVINSVAGDELYDQFGAAAIGVPFTENADYVITIDNRLEQGQFDSTIGIGDQDGFEESLKAKIGFDEWYAFFDTILFPDGPIDIYYVVYDEVGNKSYDFVQGQMANNPPSIDSLEINSTLYTSDLIKVKIGGTVSLTMNVSDVEGIDTASYKVTVAGKYAIEAGGVIGAEDMGFTGFYYGTDGIADFSSRTATSADLSVDTTYGGFSSGNWYLMTTEVNDSDGNLTTRDFYLWVNNDDLSAPIVTIDPFDQDNVSGLSGHIEGAGESPDSDNQADLSGTVNITGTVYDDTTVTSLTVEISYDSGNNWSTLGTAALGSATGDIINGYTYPWTYQWNTSNITGVADSEIMIRSFGTDGAVPTPNDTAEGDRPSLTVDIVPYITDILTGLDYGLKTYVKRSVLGKYTVAIGSTITIEGYNLAGTTTNSVNIGGTALTPSSGDTTQQVVFLGATNTSGLLTVTTNGVNSLNNLNDNNLSQNREVESYYPDRNDNRYIAFWDLINTGWNGEEAVMRPQLNAGGQQTGVDWMYVSNSDTIYLDGDKMTQSFALKGGDFQYNSSGTRIWSFLHNSKWWTDPANDREPYYGSVQWSSENNFTFTVDEHEAYNWHLETRSRLGLGSLYYAGTGQLNRYENIQIEVSGNDSATKNFLAYYDQSSASPGIVFLAFETGTGVSGYDLGAWNSTIEKIDDFLPTKEFPTAGNEGGKDAGLYNPEYAGTATSARQNIVSGAGTSKEFALKYDSVRDVAYLAYYDPSTEELKFLYNTDPMNDPTTWTAWAAPIASQAGSNVAMEVDPAGGIHLAYYDIQKGFLSYTYLSTYVEASAVVKSFTVDALYSSGLNNSITVIDFGTGDYRPVISTFSSAYIGTNAAVRIAYPTTTPLASLSEGANPSTGAFSGSWEVIAIPGVTNPQSEKTFINSTGTTPTSGSVIIGYNGSYLEEATFLDLY